MKKKIAAIALIIVCFAILSAGTLAYFTATETATNVITTGSVHIVLHEETTDGKPFPPEGIKNVMPGGGAGKVVYVENTGGADCWVRIGLDMAVTASSGEELDTGKVSLDLDEKKWTRSGGYWYYNEPLLPGQSTSALFTRVGFSADMSNAYQNAKIVINVTADAVQRANNADTALAAAGWSE